MLKNFSSLKAIVSGLQSNPIFRLKKAWQVNTSSSTHQSRGGYLSISSLPPFLGPIDLLFTVYISKAVSREKLEMFEELARIFSEDNNAVAQRELLVRSEPTQSVITFGFMFDVAGRGLQSLQTRRGRRITTCKKCCRSTSRTVGLSGEI